MTKVRVTATVDIDHAEAQLLEALSQPGFGPIASNGLLAVRALRVELAAEIARREKAEVQLAGCGVAADGWAKGDNDCSQGDYGWSPAFESTKAIRAQFDALLEAALCQGHKGKPHDTMGHYDGPRECGICAVVVRIRDARGLGNDWTYSPDDGHAHDFSILAARTRFCIYCGAGKSIYGDDP